MKKSTIILSAALLVGQFFQATSLSASSDVKLSTRASSQEDTSSAFAPGEVSKEETRQILDAFTRFITNQANRATVLTNFKVMLANQQEMGIRGVIVEEAKAQLNDPQKALFNATVEFFKTDLTIRLNPFFENMKAACPQKSELIDAALDIGVKMAILPKFLDFFATISTISPNYIGNLVAQGPMQL